MKTKVEPGEDIAAIADRIFNGDVARFTEILDLNENIDVFKDLLPEQFVEIPDIEQILNFAEPVLSDLGSTIDSLIPQELKQFVPNGYVKEAIEQSGILNGVLGEIKSISSQVKSEVERYNSPVKLVDWLLGGN